MRGRMMCSLLWVVSVEDSRQPDRSNLWLPINSAWYFATPLPFCRERLEMVPVRELPLSSLERGEDTMPSAQGRGQPTLCCGYFLPPRAHGLRHQQHSPFGLAWVKSLSRCLPLFPWATVDQTRHEAIG